MWFEYAHGKEKIIHMFNGELPLSNVELESILFYAPSTLRLVFHSKNIPLHVPDKWNKIKYNSIRISLEFSDISNFSSKGYCLGFECSPVITSDKAGIHLDVKDDIFNLMCISRFMEIQDITPFLDKRWGN